MRSRQCCWSGFRPEARTLLVLLSLVLLVPALQAGEWPQFRGPDGLGVSADATGLPVVWGPESDNIRWRTEIAGEGYSSRS